MRFAVLMHHPGEGLQRTDEVHLDWMFEDRGELRTWSTELIPLTTSPATVSEVACQPLPNHRIDYLDYEGPVSRGRGSVERRLGGHYEAMVDDDNEFTVDLRWQSEEGEQVAHVRIYRNFVFDEDASDDDTRVVAWRLRFSPGR